MSDQSPSVVLPAAPIPATPRSWGSFHPKVTASVLAMSLGTLLIDALSNHGVPLTAADSAAIITLLSFGVGYIAPSGD
jgi:hypothetical protein